jgi:hypothetical protein
LRHRVDRVAKLHQEIGYVAGGEILGAAHHENELGRNGGGRRVTLQVAFDLRPDVGHGEVDD